MTLFVDCSGSAREEIELELERNPPPDFKTIQDAIEWAEKHFPMNAYFEVWGKSRRIWYQGYVKMRGGMNQYRKGVRANETELKDGKARIV